MGHVAKTRKMNQNRYFLSHLKEGMVFRHQVLQRIVNIEELSDFESSLMRTTFNDKGLSPINY